MTNRFEDLVWGHGPRLFELFLEPTCPHSGRAFDKLRPLLETAGAENLTIRIVLQSQPWHVFSSVVSRAILAASGTDRGKDAAWTVMQAVFDARDDFICIDHSKGPNMDLSPADILHRIEDRSGIALRAQYEMKDSMVLLKRHTRYARQNGIHASPTFMVDGLIDDRIGSRDEIGKWMADIGLTETP